MSTAGPIEQFFGQFAVLRFAYRPSKTAYSNFERLCKVAGWIKDTDEWMAARVRYERALVDQFHFVFGTGEDLQSWQKLCEFIDITPIPDTVGGCQVVCCLFVLK